MKINNYVLATIILSYSCILIYSFSTDNITKGLSIFSISLLTSIASLATGAIFGFIFGIPNTKNNKEENLYERNTSLKEVSDWLTKIIIGVSLVELKSIIKYFNVMIYELADIAEANNSFTILIAAIIISFTITGFLLAYILTVTMFFKELVNSDKSIKAIIESANINPAELQITDLIKDDFKFSIEEKSAILKYVSKNGVKTKDVYVVKRLAKALYHMNEYENAALAYSWACELDKNDPTLKINEAFIRNKFLKEFERSNNLLNELIVNNSNWAVPHYNIACNYNREYRDLADSADIIEYKNKLMDGIKKHIKEAFKIDNGLLSEALKDPELEGINIQNIFDSI